MTVDISQHEAYGEVVMSHAIGAVQFPDGLILYYEYNGTVDVCVPPLWATVEEVDEHWREDGPRWECTCDPQPTPESVKIMTTYGGGFSWQGRACRKCKTLVSGLMPFSDADHEGDNFEDGEPDWSPWKQKS